MTVCMIPPLENSLFCYQASYKGLEKWLFWKPRELNREKLFHCDIMIHVVQYHARAALRFDFGLIVIPSIVILGNVGPSVPSPRLNEQKTKVTRSSEEKARRRKWSATFVLYCISPSQRLSRFPVLGVASRFFSAF